MSGSEGQNGEVDALGDLTNQANEAIDNQVAGDQNRRKQCERLPALEQVEEMEEGNHADGDQFNVEERNLHLVSRPW